MSPSENNPPITTAPSEVQGAITATDLAIGTTQTSKVEDVPSGLRPGQVLANDYQLLKVLGMGGMGGVLLAHDTRLDREVAIKYIKPRLLPQSLVRQQFLREAQAMARVRHENVVAIHYAGEIDDVPYFAMEYVAGTDLSRQCKVRGSQPFAADDALPVLRQIAGAVDAIHRAGTFHLDLKPSNVLIGTDARVVVADFGLARPADRPALWPEQSVMGSPHYLSPEIIQGATGTAASDIYSLAAIAYRLFTGRLPFTSPQVVEILRAQVCDAPTPPRDIIPTLPPALEDAILAGLSKNPQDRPRSAMQLYQSIANGIRDASSTAQQHRIIIADDDEDMCAFTRACIASEYPDAEIVTVTDGAQVLTYFMRESASLIILDLRMPHVDGFQLTRALRSLDATSRIPIIVMTASGGATEWRQLFELGASAFLAKPLTPSDVITAVKRFLP